MDLKLEILSLIEYLKNKNIYNFGFTHTLFKKNTYRFIVSNSIDINFSNIWKTTLYNFFAINAVYYKKHSDFHNLLNEDILYNELINAYFNINCKKNNINEYEYTF